MKMGLPTRVFPIFKISTFIVNIAKTNKIKERLKLRFFKETESLCKSYVVSRQDIYQI